MVECYAQRVAKRTNFTETHRSIGFGRTKDQASSVDLNPCPRTLTAKLITIFTTNWEILHVMIPETVAACPTSYFATHFLPFLS